MPQTVNIPTTTVYTVDEGRASVLTFYDETGDGIFAHFWVSWVEEVREGTQIYQGDLCERIIGRFLAQFWVNREMNSTYGHLMVEADDAYNYYIDEKRGHLMYGSQAADPGKDMVRFVEATFVWDYGRTIPLCFRFDCYLDGGPEVVIDWGDGQKVKVDQSSGFPIDLGNGTVVQFGSSTFFQINKTYASAGTYNITIDIYGLLRDQTPHLDPTGSVMDLWTYMFQCYNWPGMQRLNFRENVLMRVITFSNLDNVQSDVRFIGISNIANNQSLHNFTIDTRSIDFETLLTSNSQSLWSIDISDSQSIQTIMCSSCPRLNEVTLEGSMLETVEVYSGTLANMLPRKTGGTNVVNISRKGVGFTDTVKQAITSKNWTINTK